MRSGRSSTNVRISTGYGRWWLKFSRSMCGNEARRIASREDPAAKKGRCPCANSGQVVETWKATVRAMTRPARPSVADRSGRAYGSLALLTDSERRGLRPIGASVREVADRTAMLFDTVMKKSRNVRLFRAVCADGRDALRIPHVICAGRRVILVDSVTWPPGAYTVAESG